MTSSRRFEKMTKNTFPGRREPRTKQWERAWRRREDHSLTGACTLRAYATFATTTVFGGCQAYMMERIYKFKGFFRAPSETIPS
ncbi:hypothetical protein P280DRAFT_304815 [Massarina eburnea CBS 473.64]|uniref:Uncharacterized protein n=1 Tax=Massarina eburnea CBS 473.64 TaxID=1395130 RepID=A0A6A6S4U2_9PLEO|nr:hypothetical protein P280DRAFT_304815 [Massarina eburnea CBS 473.64]